MDLVSALAALKQTFDLIKTGVEIHDETKIKTGIGEFLDKYISLQNLSLQIQQQNLQLLEDKRLVENKYKELKEKLNERKKYSLHKVTEGVFVYRCISDNQPEHFLCQNCFDKGIKSVLRYRNDPTWGRSLSCAENTQHNINW